MSAKLTMIVVTAIVAMTTGTALALDTDPTSYAQFPDGTTTIQFLGEYLTSTNLKYSGSAISSAKAGNPKNSRADGEVGYVHYTGFYEVDGVMIDPHVIVPYELFNHVQVGGSNLNGSTGWSDPLLAVVIAPITTPDNTQVLGFGFGFIPPTGQYQPGKTFNVGGNRWQGILQIDGIEEIIPHWLVAGSFDATFFTNNVQAGNGKQILNLRNRPTSFSPGFATNRETSFPLPWGIRKPSPASNN